MSSESGDTRLHCICGQKMRISPAMYGQAGKCVGCRRKVWIPFAEEVAAFGPDIRLVEHPELMRQPGRRHRMEDAHPAAPAAPPLQKPAPAPEAKADGGTTDSATPIPKHVRRTRPSIATPPPAAHLTPAPDSPPEAGPAAPEPVQEENSDAGIVPECPALDVLDPLRRLASAAYFLERQQEQSAQQSGDGTAGTSAHPPLDAYRRLVKGAWKRLNRQLRDTLFETGQRLVAVMEEIAQTTLRFRVGEIGPELYFVQVGRLRRRREYLERLRVNLKGWLQTRDVFLAGGPMETDLATINLEHIDLDLPAPPDEDLPVLPALVDDLRESFSRHALAERKSGEWRRITEEHHLPEAALRDGRRETEALLARTRATVNFCRDRLREAIRDFEADINAVQAYDRLLIDNTLPPSRGPLAEDTRQEEAQRLAQLLDELRRARQWARAAVTANTPGDLSAGQPTLFRNVANPIPLHALAIEAVPAGAAAVSLMMLAALHGPPGLRAVLAVAALLLVVITALSRQTTRGLAYVGVWMAASLMLGMTMAGFAKSTPLLLVSAGLLTLIAWACAGLTAWMTLHTVAHWKRWLPFAALAGMALFSVGLLAFMMQPSTHTASAGQTTNPARIKPKPVEPAKPTPVVLPDTPAVAHPQIPSTPTPPNNPAVGTPLPETPPTAITIAAAVQPNPVSQTEGETQSALEGEQPAAENNATQTAAAIPPAITAELRGVLKREGSSPRFRVTLRRPDGRENRLDIGLGEKVHEAWTATEYNATTNKLTLFDGQHILILEAGEPVSLSRPSPID